MSGSSVGKKVFLTNSSGSKFAGQWLTVSDMYPRNRGMSVNLSDDSGVCVIGMDLKHIKKM